LTSVDVETQSLRLYKPKKWKGNPKGLPFFFVALRHCDVRSNPAFFCIFATQNYIK